MDPKTAEKLNISGHINRVSAHMMSAIANLVDRRDAHDASKFEEPELSGFTRLATLKKSGLPYAIPGPDGKSVPNPAYTEQLQRERATILRHYYRNDHHPEHFAFVDPVDDGTAHAFSAPYVASGEAYAQMSLTQKIEMLCDWKAASEDYNSGDIYASIEANQARFGYADAEKSCLIATARELGW